MVIDICRVFSSFIFCILISGCSLTAPEKSDDIPDSTLTPVSEIEKAFQNQRSNFSVTVKGTVTRILSDDNSGDRHQRFIIKLSNKQTLLIAHNIDIAPRVSGLSVESVVYAHGDYVWNDEGGLVHWTHLDPDGSHEDGWILFNGKKYQ